LVAHTESPANAMADVFISYVQARRELGQSLAKDLEASGFSVLWDTGLVPNQHFRKKIDAQLDAAAAVVILWTPEAVDSLWVPS
jgi:adenylate cyclase